MAELEGDIRSRYDLETFTARHTQASIFRLINDAYRDVRDRLSSDGVTSLNSFATDTALLTGPTGTLPGTAVVSTAAYLEKFARVDEVHVKDGTSWRPLREISIQDALSYTDLTSNGTPQFWFNAGASIEFAGGVAPSFTEQHVQIVVVPPLDASRMFRVVGLKAWIDLTATTDRVMTDFGLHEYAIRWAGVQLATRDDDVNLWQARKAELGECYSDLLHRMLNRTNQSAVRANVRRRR
jgi:hypothetical protein